MGSGNGYYTKSVGHEGPDFATSKRALAKSTELKPKDINCTIIFEYYSPGAIRAIPNGTMAFNRTGKATAIIMLQWDNTVADHSRRAREVAYELAVSILGDKSLLNDPLWFGYGNYGERPVSLSGPSKFKPFVDGDGPDDMKDRALSAYGPNYSRLQRVKREYDPENVFNKWFPIVPA